MANEPMTFKLLVQDLDSEMTELESMSQVLSVLMRGGMEKAPEGGRLILDDQEAAAIFWSATHLCFTIQKTVEQFRNNYEAAN